MQVQTEHHAGDGYVLRPLDLEVARNAATARIPREAWPVTNQSSLVEVNQPLPSGPPVSRHAYGTPKNTLQHRGVTQHAHLGLQGLVPHSEHAGLNIGIAVDGPLKDAVVNVQRPLRPPSHVRPECCSRPTEGNPRRADPLTALSGTESPLRTTAGEPEGIDEFAPLRVDPPLDTGLANDAMRPQLGPGRELQRSTHSCASVWLLIIRLHSFHQPYGFHLGPFPGKPEGPHRTGRCLLVEMIAVLERIDPTVSRDTRGTNGKTAEGYDGSDGSLKLTAIEGVGLDPGGPHTGKN